MKALINGVNINELTQRKVPIWAVINIIPLSIYDLMILKHIPIPFERRHNNEFIMSAQFQLISLLEHALLPRICPFLDLPTVNSDIAV